MKMEGKNPSDIVPSPYGKLFTMYDSFNAMQASLLNDLLYTDKSIVLSAPTGSGKTVVFELAIVRMLLEAENMQSTNRNVSISPKAIYIAPIKALCSEKYQNWKFRFDSVGVNCTQLTGDTQSANLMAIRQAQVVISTPEKWDSLTRRWRDFEELLSAVKLFIVDEVHLLNEDTRGPILEAIVARMKSSGVKRFVVASATIPNVEDLTSWIGSCNNRVAQYVFNEMQRPVPLEKHVLGINTKLKGFQFDMKLNYKLPEIISKYAEQKATLIFCSSRKSAEMAAFNLNKTNSILQLTNQQKSYLHQLTQQLIETKLKKLVENGIAYHHAGLQYADRSLIEASFRQGYLMVLISTSTLAMGINLPAHLVVIKSTETYIRGGYVEYPENMLLQMIGRAGRPQFDTKGVAVVLTQSNKVTKYRKLMTGKAPIESHLHKHLTEHLNSEIALNSINNLEVAMEWIRSTYLYIRSVRNPTHYGFSDNMSKDLVEHKLEELSFRQINALESAGLVTINKENGLNVQTTPIGKLMAKYYLCFETMKLFRDLKGNETLQNIFDLIVQCKELGEFILRVNEKKILNTLNKTPIRFPIKGRIKKCEEKISCIIQAVLGNLDIPAPSLVQESLKMFRIAERVSKCLLEYVRLCVRKNLYDSTENNWYKTSLNSYIAAKCFHAKLWENSEYASKQLHGIGTIYSTLLLNAGKNTLKAIANTEARTIEHILNKPVPFGDEVLQNLMTFPEYEIKLCRKSADIVAVYAKQINENYVHKTDAVAALIVGDSMNNLLLLAENFDEISIEYGYFERTIKIQNSETVEYIYGHVVHTSLVGVDVHDTLEINATKVLKSEEATKKSKKQSRLYVTNTTDSGFPPEINLNEEDNNKINNSEVTNDSKLKKYQFVKRKICPDGHKKKKTTDIIINENDTPPKIATIKPLNETNYLDNTTELNNTSNVERIVQRKLTEFFVQRKKTELMAMNTSIIDLTRETGENIRTQNVRKLPMIKSTCDNAQKFAQLNVPLKKPEFLENVDQNLFDFDNIWKETTKELQQMKRKSTPPNDIEYPSTSKKIKFQNDFSFDAANKSCPRTLASFLGEMGQAETITSLLERENFQEKRTQKQQCVSSMKSIETFDNENIGKQNSKSTASKQTLTDISCTHKASQNSQNMTAPLDLSKNCFENDNISPPKLDKTHTNEEKSTTTNDLIFKKPTSEEFELWFEIFIKFHRLPPQAKSVKNLKYVYDKVVTRKQQQIKKQTQISSQPSKSNRLECMSHSNERNNQNSINPLRKRSNSSLETNHSSSSSNQFRLQLFADDQNSMMHPSTVKRINQDVMQQVLNLKYTQNPDDNFDDNLSVALEELTKELASKNATHI